MFKDEIYGITGFESDEIVEIMSEGSVQYIFVKDDKVVCNINGNFSKLKFSFNFGEYKNGYVKISKSDQHVFNVGNENGIKYFSIIE